MEKRLSVISGDVDTSHRKHNGIIPVCENRSYGRVPSLSRHIERSGYLFTQMDGCDIVFGDACRTDLAWKSVRTEIH